MAEPMHQPFGGEVRGGGDGEHARILPLQQPFGADGDAVERISHDPKIVATNLGNDQALPLAVEQLYRKLRLERFHLMAYRPLGDTQLFGCARKTLMARGGLEGFQGVERRQAWAHRTGFMRKTKAGTRNDALRESNAQHY